MPPQRFDHSWAPRDRSWDDPRMVGSASRSSLEYKRRRKVRAIHNSSLAHCFYLSRTSSFEATCSTTTTRATAYSTCFLIQSSNMLTCLAIDGLAPYVPALLFLPLATTDPLVDSRPPHGYPRVEVYDRPARRRPTSPCRCSWRPSSSASDRQCRPAASKGPEVVTGARGAGEPAARVAHPSACSSVMVQSRSARGRGQPLRVSLAALCTYAVDLRG